MKAVKIIIAIVVLIAVVVAGVVFYGLSQLNGFVEQVIETTGTELTQTNVGVGSVDIKLSEGRGAIYSLSIANPEGYSDNALFATQSIDLSLDIESLTAPVKIVKAVNIGEISLLAEQKNIKDTNIQALLDNLQKANTSEPATSSNSPDVRLMIEKVTVAASVIDLQTEKFGGKQITLPSFTLTNIGDKKTGLTPEQAGKAITQQLFSKVKAAVKAELSQIVKDSAKDKLKETLETKIKENISTDKLKSLFK